MAFVNEWVSEADIRKYDLPAVWRKVHWTTPLQYVWTVDRERNSYLIAFSTGREEFSDQTDFVLSWNGRLNVFRLRRSVDDAGPVNKTTWHLLGFAHDSDTGRSKDPVLELLREALVAYGRGGVVVPLKNHVAVCEF